MHLELFQVAAFCNGLLAMAQAFKIIQPEGPNSNDYSPLPPINAQRILQSSPQVRPDTGVDDDQRAYVGPMISSTERKTIYQVLNDNEK